MLSIRESLHDDIAKHDRSAAEGLRLTAEIDATLAKRSIAGVLAYLVLLAIFLVSTPGARAHPLASIGALAWMIVLGAMRLTIARRFSAAYASNAARWRWQFRTATLIAGASWGIGCAGWTHVLGLGADSLIMLVSTAGVTAGAMSSLGPSVRLARAYLVCMLVPTIVTLAASSASSNITIGFALILILYLVFLTVEAGHVHGAFVEAIERTFLLEHRARELDDRTHRMRLLLDTVGQGFLSVGLDGTMGDERSAILERWLGPCGPDEKVWDYLGRIAPDEAVWIEIGLSSLAARQLPTEVVLCQLPHRFRTAMRHIEVEYRVTEADGVATGVLLILSDVTNLVERLRSEQDRHDLMVVCEHIVADRSGVVDFVSETERLVHKLAHAADAAVPDARRWLHTLKGNSAVFGLEGFSRACHELETALDETGDAISALQRCQLAEQWRANELRISKLLGSDRDVVRASRAEYSALVHAIAMGQSHSELALLVAQWGLEPAEVRLTRIANQARGLARRLDKGDIEVIVEPNGVRLPMTRLSGFWASFVHVLRNAIDHGLEPAEDRVAMGKFPTGRITVRTVLDDTELQVSLEDDGRGIDWAAVAIRARAHGLPHATRAELEAVVFADGVSTKSEVSETSGRGVGMGAVLAEVRSLGGRLTLSSDAGRGTRCVARFPRSVIVGDAVS